MQRWLGLIFAGWFAACSLGALALDGHKVGEGIALRTFTVTGFTTTLPNDVITAYVAVKSGAAVTVQSISAPGTTGWAPRLRNNAGLNNQLELWYGTATSALAAVTLTITLSGTPSVTSFASIFGISGANSAIINDPNASLPTVRRIALAGPVPSVTGVSTSFANDMIHTGLSCDDSVTQTASGAGFTLIDTGKDVLNTLSIASEFSVVGVTQSATTVGFGVLCNGSWTMFVDAVEQAAAATAKKFNPLPLLGVGN